MSVGTIAVGVIGAGATIYGASQQGDTPAPLPSNPGKDLLKYIAGLKEGMPDMLQMENEYRPQFGQLNIADQQQYLNALTGMRGQANESMQGQLDTARDRDLQSMTGRVPQVNNLLNQINPTGQQQLQQHTQLANDAYNRAQGLNFEEKRAADQQARQAFASRGRLNDNASVSAEILNREGAMQANRAEAAQLGSSAYGMSQNFTNPALGLLNQIPGSVAMGSDVVGQSAGMVGQNTPQLVNPDAGINMGMQNNANMNAYMQANAAAQSNQGAMWGAAGGSLLDLAGTMYANR